MFIHPQLTLHSQATDIGGGNHNHAIARIWT